MVGGVAWSCVAEVLVTKERAVVVGANADAGGVKARTETSAVRLIFILLVCGGL